MTSPQATRIARILGRHDRTAAVDGWLATLEATLDKEATLDDDTIGSLVARARPRWGVRSSGDADAYVAFWARLVARHDDPRLVAAYADVVYLLGGTQRDCEALDIFMTAVSRSPAVFVEYSGDFYDLVQRCGPQQQLDFELAKLAFFVHLVEHGEMDGDDLGASIRELLSTFGDDAQVRDRLRALGRELLP